MSKSKIKKAAEPVKKKIVRNPNGRYGKAGKPADKIISTPEVKKVTPKKVIPAAAEPAKKNVSGKMKDLIRGTGKVASNKVGDRIPSGTTIEQQMMNDDPTLKKAQPAAAAEQNTSSKPNEEQQQNNSQGNETQQQEQGEQKAQDNTQTNNQSSSQAQSEHYEHSGSDTLTKMINGLVSPPISHLTKKHLDDIKLTPEDIATLRTVMPAGGHLKPSWVLYFVYLFGIIGSHLPFARSTKQDSMPVDKLLEELRRMGYKIEKEIDPATIAQLEALGYEVKKKRSKLDEMISELTKNGYAVSRMQAMKNDGVEDADVI